MDNFNDFNIDEVEVEGIDDFAAGSGNIVTAKLWDKKIGEFSFDCSPDIKGEIVTVTLHYATVNEEYKHRGVGTKIIKMVKESYPNIVARNTMNNLVEDKNDIHYSDEGLRFITACIGKELIRDLPE